MRKTIIALVCSITVLLFVGCENQKDECAVISNDLSSIEYNGQDFVLCSEDLFIDGRTKPDDVVKINSRIADYDLLPILEYCNLYFSNTYPNYLFLDTSLDESYKEFLDAQIGATVLYKKVSN